MQTCGHLWVHLTKICCLSKKIHNFLKICPQAVLACLRLFPCLDPNVVESCQKSIDIIKCNLAISYNSWQRSLIFLTQLSETNENEETKHTKSYIEATCCLKITDD